MKETLYALINQLQNNPELLTNITYNPEAKKAVHTLIWLCREIKGSPVLEFIQLHLSENVNVMSKWSNNTLSYLYAPIPVMKECDQIPPSAPPGDTALPRSVVPLRGFRRRRNAGVYVWSTTYETMQYVGSTINQYARYMGHAEDFINCTEKRQQKMYQWRNGERSWQLRPKPRNSTTDPRREVSKEGRREVYSCYNYFKEFVQSHPHYTLSLLELHRLKLMTELIPRILEQSLLKRHPFHWNVQKTVRFCFINYKVKMKDIMVIKDPITKKCLQSPIYDYSHASALLDIPNLKVIRHRRLNNEPIYSRFHGQYVLIEKHPSPLLFIHQV